MTPHEQAEIDRLRKIVEGTRGNGNGGGIEPPLGPRPVIIVRPGERHLAADSGLAALAIYHTAFFRRHTELVRVCRIEGKDSQGAKVWTPGIVPIDVATLQRGLAAAAVWQKPKGKKFVAIDPPEPVAKQMMSMIEEWPFPVLRGVIGTQTLRPDGSVLDAPGYDDKTGLYLVDPPPMPLLPEYPDWDDAHRALEVLKDLLAEFMFADDEDLSRSAAVSMLMTTVLRGMMGVAPLHAVTKPEAGTGGSYLSDIAAMIATGTRCPVLTPSDDPEETEKRLVAAALSGQPIIALDNVSSTLEGDFLCQLVERPRPQVRRLGSSQMFTLDNTWTVFANGNQLQIAGDMVRRTVAFELDADMENPDERNFKRNPLKEIERDRGRYVAAILTIARAYILAGRPERLNPKASFEEWSDNVRSALVWLEWPDPTGSTAKMRADDPARRQRNLLFSAWAVCLSLGTGYQTRELIAEAKRTDASGNLKFSELDDALRDIAPGRSTPVDPKALGKWLSRNQNTIVDKLKLTVDRSDAARPRWMLSSVKM